LKCIPKQSDFVYISTGNGACGKGIFTEPLPSNDMGILAEPLPSNDKGIFTEPLPTNDRGIFLPSRFLATIRGFLLAVA
jgi:hypothetical protein